MQHDLIFLFIFFPLRETIGTHDKNCRYVAGVHLG